jgi:hypothetical protein
LALIAKPGYADCIELKDKTGDENKPRWGTRWDVSAKSFRTWDERGALHWVIE